LAKFVFRLESLLRARIAEERARQMELAAVERERVMLEDEIRGYQSTITAEREDMRDRLAPGAPVQLINVRLQSNAAFHASALAGQAAIRLAGVYRKVEAARRNLLEAAKKRKAVEKLRENRLDEWKAEQKARDAAAIDEMAVMRASRGESLV